MHRSAQIRCLFAVFLSGAAALTLEILWQRQMLLCFGASAPATTAVLTAIFLGIAFGSLLANPMLARTRHPLILFAAMEFVIGVWGFCLPSLLPVTLDLYAAMALKLGEENSLLNLVRFLMAVGLLLPATLSMGATIPVMVSAMSGAGQTRVSVIYGLNTLGAVLGAIGTGLVLLPVLGMSQTRLAAVSFNAASVMIALWTLRHVRGVKLPVPPDRIQTSRPSCLLPASMYFAAGYVALGLEVVWLRLLGIVNSNSTLTFSLALAVYLLAMGLGSLVLFPVLHRFLAARSIFGFANFAVAASAIAVFPIVYIAPQLNYRRITEVAASGQLKLADLYITESMLIAILMFLPSLFMGLMYPAVCHWFPDSPAERVRWTGTAYFLGTLGSVVGILTVSMVLIPAVGLLPSFGFLVIVSTGLGCLTLTRTHTGFRRWMAAGCSAALCSGAVWTAIEARPILREFPARKIGDRWFEYSVVNSQTKVSEIRRFKAGRSATVIIKKKPDSDDHLVFVDDQLVASTNMEARVDALMLAHLPLLLHPDPLNELTVGFGSGGTSHAITTHAVDAYCVEIEPEVPRSASLLGQQNFGILENPRFHLILNDARDHLNVGTRTYDVIATDVTNLQYKQNSSLYTVEYFQLMKKQLRPGGIACAWIPMAAISTGELRILMKSFQHVFPHATLWFINHTHTNFGILIGTPNELLIDFARMEQGCAIPAVAENLRLIGITDPLQIVYSLHLAEDEYQEFCGDVVLHTDNDPVLEFSSPLSFYQYNQTFRDNLRETLQLRPHDLRRWVQNFPEARSVDQERHRLASLSFCRVLVNFYDYLIHRGRGDRERTIASLTAAMTHAAEGMDAWPDDHSREAFYIHFFAQAQQWLSE